MRSIVPITVCIALAAAVLPQAATAQTAIRVSVDGAVIRLVPPPVVINGRVLVPLRGVFEKMEALVEWKPVSRTAVVLRPGIYVELRVGSATASVSGAPVRLDVPAQMIGGWVFVPLRFISETLGVHVLWRAADRMVVISTQTAGPVQGRVDVSVSASGYAVGQPVVVTIANGTTASVYTEDSKTDCSIVTLERRTPSGWEAIPGCRFGRPPLIVQITPGGRATATVSPRSTHLAFGAGQLGFGAGTYRIKFTYSFTRGFAAIEQDVAYSVEFPIR